MSFIKHNDVKPGDKILYSIEKGSLVYYEVLKIKFSSNEGTIVSGRSFGPYGQRWLKGIVRDEDLIPHTRDVFLISRKGEMQ